MTTPEFAPPLDLTGASPEFRERFWSKVDKRGPDECWEWKHYCKPPGGYGQFTLRKGVFMTASRVALALTIGVIPAGHLACHTCDNPPCCNPAHLFAGTSRENTLDSVAKGRAKRARGTRQASARLTEREVLAIRAATPYHGVLKDLAAKYGVSATTIRRIRNRQTWTHVGNAERQVA